MEFSRRKRARINRLRKKGMSSKEIASKVRVDEYSIRGYIANLTKKKELKKIKKSLLILECTSEAKEKMSESLLLQELVRIFHSSIELRIEKVRGKQRFINELKNAQELFIHISAHGKYRKGKRVHGTFVYFPSGTRFHANDLKKREGFWGKRRKSSVPKLVVLSACETGRQDMAKALWGEGCRYFIAPKKWVSWVDAAIFLTVFYRLFLVENHSIRVSFKKAHNALISILPDLSGRWTIYDKGESVPWEYES